MIMAMMDVGDFYFRLMKLYLKEFKLMVISKKILLLLRITTIRIKYKTRINKLLMTDMAL